VAALPISERTSSSVARFMTPAVTIGRGTNGVRTGADETYPARPALGVTEF
jgi:hypothetical protein